MKKMNGVMDNCCSEFYFQTSNPGEMDGGRVKKKAPSPEHLIDACVKYPAGQYQ